MISSASSLFQHKRFNLLGRLLGREYLPAIGSLLTWSVITAAAGPKGVVPLLTAVVFMNSARALTKANTNFALARRVGSDKVVYRTSVRRALGIEAVSLTASAAILAGIIAFLYVVGQPRIAELAMVVALAMPARSLSPAAGPRNLAVWRGAVAWSGLALAGISMVAGLGIAGFAMALAAREWIALATMFSIPSAARLPSAAPATAPLTSHEVAQGTASRARHRFAYYISKGPLGFLPLGNLVARTIRGIGGHRRLSRLTSRSAYPIILIALGAPAAALLLPFASAEPVALLTSAALLRFGAAAGNVLIWWRFARDDDDDDDVEDD